MNCFEAIKFASNEIPEPFLVLEIQETTASCERALATFNHAAGPRLTSLWKDALDRSKGRLGLEVRSEMLRAAWRDEYWDLAQQVPNRFSLANNFHKTGANYFSFLHDFKRNFQKYRDTTSHGLLSRNCKRTRCPRMIEWHRTCNFWLSEA